MMAAPLKRNFEGLFLLVRAMAKGHENLIPMDKRSKEEARRLGREGGIKSGETRRMQSLAKKTGYTNIKSLDKLLKFQEDAIASGKLELAAKIEDQICKLMGFYVEKVAQTDSDGNDKYEPPVINILPVKVKNDTDDDNAGENAISPSTEEQI